MNKQDFTEQELEELCRFPGRSEDNGSQPYRMADITWRIFRIMAEFVEGFQFLSTTKKEVSIFGSARMPDTEHWYQETVRLTKMLGEAGFTTITGGGPGIMEAANKGAYESGAPSVGLNILLPSEQRVNAYVTKSRAFHYFFTRKVMLTASGQAYVFCPGGFGTMDEFFEIITLIQTKKMQPVPVVCLGHEYWDGLVDWIKETMRDQVQTISPEDVDLFTVVDTAEEAFDLIKDSKERSFF
ncbi:MAG TPA: TIGR00730 family Rossman fold protein [Patescibacteria group bacterium]|nr:TIGR00730 family Rossman fold protein [Patescibacteria group bacterium]